MGAIWLMVAIGMRSAERAKLPTLTAAWLIRPLIGARMKQKLSCTLRFSTAALSARIAARMVSPAVRALSTLSCGVAPLPTSSE